MASIYETYTYEEIKNLPDDQKITALKELKAIYPDNKDLAKHLDTAHIAVSNMVGKYLEGKTVGRTKMTDEEKAQAKAKREAEKKLKAQKEKEQQEQELKQQTSQTQTQEQVLNTDQGKVQESQSIQKFNPEPKTNSNLFTINLNKDIMGEEATAILNGFANTLLKGNNYKVSLNIEEV